MDISGRHIVELIEEKVVLLRQGLVNHDQEIIKDCAITIEAYCQLLKKGSKIEKPKNTSTSEKTGQPKIQLPKEDAEKFGSLLDF